MKTYVGYFQCVTAFASHLLLTLQFFHPPSSRIINHQKCRVIKNYIKDMSMIAKQFASIAVTIVVFIITHP